MYSTQSIGRSRHTEHSGAEVLSSGRLKDPFVDDEAASGGQRLSAEALGIVLPFKATVVVSSPNCSWSRLSHLGIVMLPDSTTADDVEMSSTLCYLFSLSTGKGGTTLLANRSATALLEQPIGDASLHF